MRAALAHRMIVSCPEPRGSGIGAVVVAGGELPRTSEILDGGWPMDPYESPHYRAATARPRAFRDAYLYYGPFAATKLEADERHEKARHWAALWSATHPVRARAPGAWRCWLGTLLVRAGTRLQGLPPRAAEPAPAG
jgi:hypothetical protein